MAQIRGVKGEAVVSRRRAIAALATARYCEPLTTLEMEYHRLSQRVNKMKIQKNHSSPTEEIQSSNVTPCIWLGFFKIENFFVLFTLN